MPDFSLFHISNWRCLALLFLLFQPQYLECPDSVSPQSGVGTSGSSDLDLKHISFENTYNIPISAFLHVLVVLSSTCLFTDIVHVCDIYTPWPLSQLPLVSCEMHQPCLCVGKCAIQIRLLLCFFLNKANILVTVYHKLTSNFVKWDCNMFSKNWI